MNQKQKKLMSDVKHATDTVITRTRELEQAVQRFNNATRNKEDAEHKLNHLQQKIILEHVLGDDNDET